MSVRYLIHPFKFGVAAATVAASIVLAGVMAMIAEWRALILLLLIAALFAAVMAQYGAVLSMDGEAVREIFLGVERKKFYWSEIREVGVVSTRVFASKERAAKGHRYIYFSKKELSEQERFALALKWPPKDLPFMLWQKDRLDAVQRFWQRPVASYLAGDIFY